MNDIRKFRILVDGEEAEFQAISQHWFLSPKDSSSNQIYVDQLGALRLSSALSDVTLNGRLLPHHLKSIPLYHGDVLTLGKVPMRVEVFYEEFDASPPKETRTIKLGSNIMEIANDRQQYVGLEDTDCRLIVRCQGGCLFIAATNALDVVFVWNEKANYLFQDQWYRIEKDDEIRVGRRKGPRLEFLDTRLPQGTESDITLPGERHSSASTPIIFIEDEMIEAAACDELEKDKKASEEIDYHNTFTEHVACLSEHSRLSMGIRLRRAAIMNDRFFYVARRLEDDARSLIEFSVPDHRYSPRFNHEQGDFALSTTSHAHLMPVVGYTNIEHVQYKHGPYHVRSLRRFKGVGLEALLLRLGKFNARSTLNIMMTTLLALEHAAGNENVFKASDALIESLQSYGGGPPSKYEKRIGSFLPGRFSLEQLWLRQHQDGRFYVMVDCFERRIDNQCGDWLNAGLEDVIAIEGLPDEQRAIVKVGQAIHRMVTGKPIFLHRPTPECPEIEDKLALALIEIAISCVKGTDSDRPESLSAVRQLLELELESPLD